MLWASKRLRRESDRTLEKMHWPHNHCDLSAKVEDFKSASSYNICPDMMGFAVMILHEDQTFLPQITYAFHIENHHETLWLRQSVLIAVRFNAFSAVRIWIPLASRWCVALRRKHLKSMGAAIASIKRFSGWIPKGHLMTLGGG